MIEFWIGYFVGYFVGMGSTLLVLWLLDKAYRLGKEEGAKE